LSSARPSLAPNLTRRLRFCGDDSLGQFVAGDDLIGGYPVLLPGFALGPVIVQHRLEAIQAHAHESPGRRVIIWKDNDPNDEFAPRVLEQVVYNDEGRGAFPLLKRDYGSPNADKLIQIANASPIRGGSVMNVVYDATASKLWVYAKGDREAFLRPYALIDLEKLDADKDGTPDLQAVLH
jgi:isopenicillin-N N-acyltransferase like protein